MNLLQKLLINPSREVLRGYTLANLAAQILIVVTGGVVRLTGSGLGCPTWPKCTDASLVTVPEQGIHGVIEFANRALTGVLVVLAALAFIAAIRQNSQLRSRLVWPSVLVVAGIFAQAVVGGVSVLVKLNPWIVAAHFLLSGILIVIASLLHWRALEIVHQPVPQFIYRITPYISILGVTTVIIGVLVTGAGPHAGDAKTPRNGLPLEIFEHLHSYPGYVLLTLLIMAFGFARKNAAALHHASKILRWLLVAVVVQAAIGILQARLGVPPILVAIHMLGASVIISLLTMQFLSVRGKR